MEKYYELRHYNQETYEEAATQAGAYTSRGDNRPHLFAKLLGQQVTEIAAPFPICKYGLTSSI
jgi:hypothetical protein